MSSGCLFADVQVWLEGADSDIGTGGCFRPALDFAQKMSAPGFYFFNPLNSIPPTLVYNVGALPHSPLLQMAKAPMFWC